MTYTGLVLSFCANLYLTGIIQTIMGTEISNLKIEEAGLCNDGAVQKIHFFIHPKNLNPGLQLVDVNLSIPVSVGNNVNGKILFEINTHLSKKHSWIYLFEIEDDFCQLMSRYVGELWYDLQRGLGMIPHSCPIPRGSYHAVNFLMDYRKLRMQTFPLGRIRITINVFDKANQDIQGCLKVIASMSA